MNLELALKTVYTKMLGDNSIPVRARIKENIFLHEIESLYNSLDFLINYYENKTSVPKKLAFALMDTYGMFSFKYGFYDEQKTQELEDIGIMLQEKAALLFNYVP